MKTLPVLLSLLLLPGFVRATDVPDISHYQVIIDRSPFGAVSAAGAAVVQPAFSANFQLVGLVVSNAGTGLPQAIIYDKEANRSYFKTGGEMIDGNVKVVRVELLPPKAILQSMLETATLTFQERPNAPGPTSGAMRPPMMRGFPPQLNVAPGSIPPRRIPFRPR